MKPYTTQDVLTRNKEDLFCGSRLYLPYLYSTHLVDITLLFIKNAPPWNSGEPNNHGSNEDCVSMYKERPVWNDIPCSSYRIYSICEFTPHGL